MPIRQLRPRVIRQVHQHRPRPRCSTAIQIKTVIADHHHVTGRHLPGFGQFQQTAGMWFRWCFVATQHILNREAVSQADRLQRHVRQLTRIARENAEAITARMQVAHQLHRAGGRGRAQRQIAFVLEQPGMLGRCFIRWQCSEMGEDVVLWRNRQRHANRRKVMHGDGQRAVHVEHPMANRGQAHAQSLRWRIRPS